MRSRAIAGVILSLMLSMPFAGFAMGRTENVLHGWKSVVVSPGTALALEMDAHFPVRERSLRDGGLLDGLGRYMFISLSINCLLYGLLLYPMVRVFLVPKIMKMIPRYSGDAFWMQR
jgi:hypothetical protein